MTLNRGSGLLEPSGQEMDQFQAYSTATDNHVNWTLT